MVDDYEKKSEQYGWTADETKEIAAAKQVIKELSAFLAEATLIQDIKDTKMTKTQKIPVLQKTIDDLAKWKLASDDLHPVVVSKALESLHA